MKIDDVFFIKSTGLVVVTGHISKGQISQGDKLLVKKNGLRLPVNVEKIEVFHREVTHAKEGDWVGLRLSGVTDHQVQRGDELVHVD
jgi:selenocysteine-specific translation elongation factor